jgi:hypothetical protein
VEIISICPFSKAESLQTLNMWVLEINYCVQGVFLCSPRGEQHSTFMTTQCLSITTAHRASKLQLIWSWIKLCSSSKTLTIIVSCLFVWLWMILPFLVITKQKMCLQNQMNLKSNKWNKERFFWPIA